MIGTRDGNRIFEARAGRTVGCPPAAEHWHGAAPDRFTDRIALWEGTGDDTPGTWWAEPVTEQQYDGPRTRGHEWPVRRGRDSLPSTATGLFRPRVYWPLTGPPPAMPWSCWWNLCRPLVVVSVVVLLVVVVPRRVLVVVVVSVVLVVVVP